MRDKLRKEVGDTFVYIDLLAQSQGFTVAAAAVEVFNAKSDELGCSIRVQLPVAREAGSADAIPTCADGESIETQRLTQLRSDLEEVIHQWKEETHHPFASSGYDDGCVTTFHECAEQLAALLSRLDPQEQEEKKPTP